MLRASTLRPIARISSVARSSCRSVHSRLIAPTVTQYPASVAGELQFTRPAMRSYSIASAEHDSSADGTFMSRASANRIPPAEPWRRHESPDPDTTPTVFTFFEKATSTWQYVVVDPKTNNAVIIDPVLDYEPNSGTISTETADGLVSFVEHNELRVTHIL